MTTYRHYSPTTVHVLRYGVRIGSLYRVTPGSWFLEHPAHETLTAAEILASMSACIALHGHFASPERVEALNRKP
jgi:hypothetical protein